jgi:hypothetical protein
MQTALFDKQASEQAKCDGMTRAEKGARVMLSYARAIATYLARKSPDGITADDVVQELVWQGYDVHCLGNAAGSLFRGPEWEFTGQRRKSARVHAHANKLKVWRLR